MFYFVAFRIKNNERPATQFCVNNQDDLFDLLWILDHEEKVIEFIVQSPGFSAPLTNKDFNWGPFNKWVNQLYKNRGK